MSLIHRPGVILAVPEVIDHTFQRNNLNDHALIDIGKLKEYLSIDELTLLSATASTLNRIDSDFCFTDFKSVWDQFPNVNNRVESQENLLAPYVIDVLSYSDEEYESEPSRKMTAKLVKYYEIVAHQSGNQVFYKIVLKKGFLNACKDKSYRDKVIRDLYQSLTTYTSDSDIYDWNLPIVLRFIKSLRSTQS